MRKLFLVAVIISIPSWSFADGPGRGDFNLILPSPPVKKERGLEELKKAALESGKALVVYNGLPNQPIPGMLSCSLPAPTASITVYVPAKGELWKMVLEGSRTPEDIQRETAKYKADIESGGSQTFSALMDVSAVPQTNIPIQFGLINANVNFNRTRSCSTGT